MNNRKENTFSEIIKNIFDTKLLKFLLVVGFIWIILFIGGFFILSAFNKESNVDKKENVVSKQENIKKDFSQPISVQELLKTYK
jgi:hypothetical protein